jgi:hypothetical protein
MHAGSIWTGGRRTENEDEYFCPVCGVPLARSDFEKPEDQYFCPYCSTRQTPARV